jgi:hypothetical protein
MRLCRPEVDEDGLLVRPGRDGFESEAIVSTQSPQPLCNIDCPHPQTLFGVRDVERALSRPQDLGLGRRRSGQELTFEAELLGHCEAELVPVDPLRSRGVEDTRLAERQDPGQHFA